MSEIQKNLGHATAYGYAKSKGYTGTEDEFAALMADYAEVGERAEAAATAAAASATAASGSATAAAESATQAAGSATTAENKATEAAQSATAAAGSATAAGQSATAAQTAQTAAETAQTAAENAAESVSASAAQIAQNTANISSVKNAISRLDDNFAWMSIAWEQGSINNSGEDETNSYFVRSGLITISDNVIIIDPQSKQAITVYVYSAAGVFESKTSDYKVLTTISYTNKKIRFRVRKEPIAAVTPSTIGTILIYKSFDGIAETQKKLAELTQTVSQLHAQVGTYYIPLESGYVANNTETGAFIYANDTKRVRTAHEITLPQGAVISLSDYSGKRMNIYYTLPNGHGGYTGWRTSDYTVGSSNAGQSFAIMLAYDPDAEVADITDFSDLFSIVLPDGLTDRVSDLEKQFSALDVPSYWKTTLETKESEINTLDATVGENGCSFVFWTDMHWPANNKKSPSLIKHILEHTGVTEVVCGGDILGGGYASLDLAYQGLVDFRNLLNEYEIELLSIRGNHDLTPDGTMYLTDNQFYGAMLKPFAKLATLIRKTYYYRDDETLKIRYYYLDSREVSSDSLDADQIAWLEANLNTVPSDWSIIVFVHAVHIPASASSADTLQPSYPAYQISQALGNTNKKSQLIAMIGGHTHRDEITTNYGCLLISVTTDAGGTTASDWDANYPTRTAGTTTEQAFDVFHIDIVNRVIYMTRIGAGADRQISY